MLSPFTKKSSLAQEIMYSLATIPSVMNLVANHRTESNLRFFPSVTYIDSVGNAVISFAKCPATYPVVHLVAIS